MIFRLLRALSYQRRDIAARAGLSPIVVGTFAMLLENEMHGCAAVMDVEFSSLTDRYSSEVVEVIWLPSMVGLQMDLHVERPVRSASGVLHLMPLVSAAQCGNQRRAGGTGGRHSGGRLWGMGQIGLVLVSVSFTLNTVTKLNMCQGLRPAPHLDTVPSAPALTCS